MRWPKSIDPLSGSVTVIRSRTEGVMYAREPRRFGSPRAAASARWRARAVPQRQAAQRMTAPKLLASGLAQALRRP